MTQQCGYVCGTVLAKRTDNGIGMHSFRVVYQTLSILEILFQMDLFVLNSIRRSLTIRQKNVNPYFICPCVYNPQKDRSYEDCKNALAYVTVLTFGLAMNPYIFTSSWFY